MITQAKDGSKRLLIKFNIEGPYSRGFVWAQVRRPCFFFCGGAQVPKNYSQYKSLLFVFSFRPKQVSSILDHKSGEWVYLIVQNKKGGEITTLCDNRRVIEDLASAKTPEVRAWFWRRKMKTADFLP